MDGKSFFSVGNYADLLAMGALTGPAAVLSVVEAAALRAAAKRASALNNAFAKVTRLIICPIQYSKGEFFASSLTRSRKLSEQGDEIANSGGVKIELHDRRGFFQVYGKIYRGLKQAI